VLVPFGRGGLAAGLAWAFEADVQGPHDRGVWGVESEMSCAMALSLERATAVAVEEPRSTGTALADSLQGGLSANPFARARAAIAGVVVASEAQIAAAMVHAYRDMGLVLEGGAALALAPALFGLPEGLRGGDLVVILTGRNVGREQLEAVLADARVSGCGD
jgi:threonine dehydratase